MRRGRPKPVQPVDLQILLRGLHELHARADDDAIWMWPDEQDAIGVLSYTRQHHKALPIPTFENQDHDRADQAKLRLTVIRHLEQLLDGEKLAAIDDGRRAGLTWARIADVLGQDHPGSAQNLRDRLYATATNPHALRDPQAGRRAEAAKLAAEDQERRHEVQVALAVARRHKEVQDVARSLLENSADLPINDDAATWLSGVRSLVDIENPTTTEQQSLAAHVALTASEIFLYATVEEIPAANTPEARAALDAARAIT